MTIIYQNPLRGIKNPAQIKAHVAKAIDPDLSFQESREVVGWLKGAIQVHEKDGHRAAVVHMKQAILRCRRLQMIGEHGG